MALSGEDRDWLDGKFGVLQTQFQEHAVEDARVQQELLDSTKNSHRRHDAHEAGHRRYWAIIAAIVATLATALTLAERFLFSHGNPVP